ncbi:MAG: sigma-54 dependent transcriptional regulator [Burkholderiaceae bacterium]
MKTGQSIVFFVDDEEHVRGAARQALEIAGFDVLCLERAEGLSARLSRDWFGVVISDVRLPGIDGMSLLREVVALDPDIPVVLITGHGDISMAVEAMRDGAYDFIEKPFSSTQLVEVARRATEKRSLVLDNRALRAEIDGRIGLEGILVGRSPGMARLRQQIEALASTDVDVLIMGETGTGKELVARCLHDFGPRRHGPFVALNCGALPETIIESELFGHEAGAFTGASKRRIGKFEHANGGTVFLDEIETMPMSLQVRLLRVLQERSIERLGSNEPIPLDVRVLAATKRDLRQACDANEFREDLYYRINVVTLTVPPLRERSEDVALLFQHFVVEASLRYRRAPPAIDPDTLQRLMADDWRGNVRELRNAAERYAMGLEPPSDDSASGGGCAARIDAFERSLIEQALRDAGGSVKRAHEALGIARKTFYEKMKKHGLSRSSYLDD